VDSSILGGFTSIGRYFTVVSLLPSAAFTAYIYLLFKTGAWGGAVNWSAAVKQFNIDDAALLTIASFVIALAMHPLQFALTQLLEGYWGAGSGSRQIALLRIAYHRRRCQLLENRATAAASALEQLPPHERPNGEDASLDALDAFLVNYESQRLRADYPEEIQDIRPTRLGNVLRRYEASAGSTYGLEAIPSVPRLAVVAQPPELDYLQSQRMQMDLAVRTSVLAMAATLITVAVMFRHQAWLLVALVPYAVAYSAYRGAVTVAGEYGTALAVLIEVSRFSLYERLRLPLPKNLGEERDQNKDLMKAFRLQRRGLWFNYAESKPSATEGTAPTTSSQPPSDGSENNGSSEP
jgi:hypothetical protein